MLQLTVCHVRLRLGQQEKTRGSGGKQEEEEGHTM